MCCAYEWFIESVRLNGSPVRCSYFHNRKAVWSVATKCKYRLILSVVDDEESYWLNRISLVSWIYVFNSRFESNQLLLSFLGRKKQRAAQNKCGLAQVGQTSDHLIDVYDSCHYYGCSYRAVLFRLLDTTDPQIWCLKI